MLTISVLKRYGFTVTGQYSRQTVFRYDMFTICPLCRAAVWCRSHEARVCIMRLLPVSTVHTPFHIMKTCALCLIEAGGEIALTFSSCFIASPLCTPRYTFFCARTGNMSCCFASTFIPSMCRCCVGDVIHDAQPTAGLPLSRPLLWALTCSASWQHTEARAALFTK
jgi:hypothetical protein